MRYGIVALCGMLTILVACDWKSSEKKEVPTQQRTDYTPEEFGIGRKHTPDRACNREIDRLLDQIRLCYRNSSSPADCDSVQKKNSDKIKRLKNTVRCAK